MSASQPHALPQLLQENLAAVKGFEREESGRREGPMGPMAKRENSCRAHSNSLMCCLQRPQQTKASKCQRETEKSCTAKW